MSPLDTSASFCPTLCHPEPFGALQRGCPLLSPSQREEAALSKPASMARIPLSEPAAFSWVNHCLFLPGNGAWEGGGRTPPRPGDTGWSWAQQRREDAGKQARVVHGTGPSKKLELKQLGTGLPCLRAHPAWGLATCLASWGVRQSWEPRRQGGGE